MHPTAGPARRTPWRPRQIWLAGALVGAVGLAAVVAVVAEGTPLLGRERPAGEGTLEASLPGWLLAVFMLVGVAAVIGTVVLLLTVRPVAVAGQSRRRRGWWLLVALVGVLALALLLPDRDQPRQERRDVPGSLVEGSRVTEPERNRNPWPAIVLGVAVVAALVTAAVATRRRARALRPPDEPSDTARDEMHRAVVAGLEDLRREPDPRRAIVLAYGRLLDGLASAGVPRRPQDTPQEHLARTLARLDVAPDPVRVLTGLYGEARFSSHPLGDADKAAALDALVATEADLAARPEGTRPRDAVTPGAAR